MTTAAIPAPITQPTDCTAVNRYDWNVDVARAICMAESSGNTNAQHLNDDGSVDRGLMQINSIHADMVSGNLGALFNAQENVKIAYSLYSAHGWTAWSTYNNGAYERFL